jgi:EAL domain-containing protein (putative c-di-GMP-specific phosphodiesterase class I)
MKRQADERLELEADLRQALQSRSDELYLVFQPIVALDGSQEIIEVEALLRWNHPTLGHISPGRFVPLAEEIGLIHDLTVWVLEEACGQMAQWSRHYVTHTGIRMSVNISAMTVREPDLADWVLDCLQRVGLSPNQLVLEITESILMTHSDAIATGLQRLRERGVQVAIDDFGTGYSSMSSLAHLPVDIIKIDQSFVARLDQTPETHAILQAMVELARAMQLSVVSEGIETTMQRESLQRLGSHYGQGYLFSHPLRAEDLEALLAQRLTPLNRAA